MYVEKKKISGKEYYYLKASIRKDGKVTTKTIAYLGKGNMSKKELEQAVKKHEKKPLLKDLGAVPGDIVEIRTKTSLEKGILMPSFDENIVFIKLDSGYNIGVEKSNITSVKKTGNSEPVEFPSLTKKQDQSLPGISFIATGGTISSRIDYKTGGVKWLMKPEQLLYLAPDLLDIVKINKIKRPFAIASENMSPKHWAELAKKTAELLNDKKNQGVIITHGTDTLHYTSAALSFMLKNLNKPVVLTYAQKSTDRGSTDTVLNLTCSAKAAVSDIAEVMLVGHAETDDSFCYALRGTKVRKMHTSRRDTFRPINCLPIAKISDGIEIISEHKKTNDEKVVVDTKFEDKIALVKFYPGADPSIIEHHIKEKYKGIVIEATGLGHVATGEAEKNWKDAIKKAIDAGITVCFAPQTLYGRLDPYVYSPARELLDLGVIYLEDMLPETAYVKLGWVLGHEKNKDKIKEMMLENIAGEFNKKISDKTFLY